MKNTRLLFVAPTDRLKGGGEVSHYELILGAKRRGYDVHVVVPARGKLAQQLRANGIKVTVIPYYWWSLAHHPKRAGYDLLSIKKICRLAEKLGSQAVITNSFNIPWGALAAAAANLPHVWLAREMPLYQYSYLENRYNFFTGYGNLIMANSKTNAAYISGRINQDVGYFYPYVDIHGHQLSKVKGPARFVNVGSVQAGKNQLELIKAAAILQRRGQLKNKVILIGARRDHGYLEQLTSVINKNGLERMVKFVEFKEYPYESIKPNDIFVQTSIYESFGRTTVEAMELGLVCVGADIPATRELFGVAGGVLYQAGSANSLAKTLKQITDNPRPYQQLAQKAKAKALKNFSESACHDPFFKAISSIIGQENKRQELVHLLPHLQAAAEISRKNWQDFDSIVNSKAWRAALLARKILYGWRR